MKFHLFSRGSVSSNFETRLGYLTTFEGPRIKDILVQLVNYRYEYFDWEEEFTKEDLTSKFITKLFESWSDVPQTPDGMLEVIEKIQGEKLPTSVGPVDQAFRTILESINEDLDVPEPLLIIKETKSNVLLLRHLGIE